MSKRKYPTEFKLEVVKYYIDEHCGYRETARHFNLPTGDELVKKWVKRYEEHGINGLCKNLKSTYSGDFKINVIKYMNTNHLSLKETAFHFNLGHHDVVKRWQRIYYEEGPQALYEERRGRSKNMSSKHKKKKSSEDSKKDLIAELQQLRMENEYLKKLNALVQERIKRENKKK